MSISKSILSRLFDMIKSPKSFYTSTLLLILNLFCRSPPAIFEVTLSNRDEILQKIYSYLTKKLE
ncbi:MAG: hypothetical protein COS40_14430 [Deltaproteobacteria bacterium CG03_land_8_20_14_0_80_45_14]|nr:MAG: hypothetical protein COS40_14430 [Deltaproteobacteria bacterium CG03_land_8_20_14_0_80_45_14]